MIADEGGPAPAHRQAGRCRVSHQAPGEAGHEVLVVAGGGTGTEYEPVPGTAGQLLQERAVTAGGRHGAGRRAGYARHHGSAGAPDVSAAQRGQLSAPQNGVARRDGGPWIWPASAYSTER